MDNGYTIKRGGGGPLIVKIIFYGGLFDNKTCKRAQDGELPT